MISVPEDVRAREIKKNPNMKAREAGAIAKRFSDKRPRSAKSASKRAEKGEKSQSNTAKEHQFTEIIHHYMDHDTIKLLKSINTSGAAGDRVLAALKGLRNQIDKEIKRIEDSRKIGGVK